MKSIALDPGTWDLILSVSGNIGTVDDGLALAQNAASACRLFKGELWFDTSKGIPFWSQILSRFPPLALVKAQFVAAALGVTGVTAAKCVISSLNGRRISGQIQVTDRAGKTTLANF